MAPKRSKAPSFASVQAAGSAHGHTRSGPAGVPTVTGASTTGSTSVPTYTGTPCDHRSAWITLIACQKH